MKAVGDIVLFRFPQADLTTGKLRPALLVSELPGEYDDWLVCMISSQTRHYLTNFDELIQTSDSDYSLSGLKLESVIRTGRLAVISGNLLLGEIGQISNERIKRIKNNLAEWILK
jgi:mRNA interferase MazF